MVVLFSHVLENPASKVSIQYCKADKLSIKQLTKGAPSVAAMIEEAKAAKQNEQEISNEANCNVRIEDQHDCA